MRCYYQRNRNEENETFIRKKNRLIKIGKIQIFIYMYMTTIIKGLFDCPL